MDECMLAQYKLTCRRILDFLRTELVLHACVVYHSYDEESIVEFITGNLPGVVEGKPNASLECIAQLIHSGSCSSIVLDVSQSPYHKHKVFHELNPVAIVAMPLSSADDTEQSILCGISFEQGANNLLHQQSLLQFCADQLNNARNSFLRNLDNIQTIESLTEQAYQDSMTGLLNRNGWEAAVAVVIANGFTHSQCASVFVVDVDNLKKLNDTEGHAAGDAVICHVAAVLQKHFDSQTTISEAIDHSFVARTGGDEFVGLIYDCDDECADKAKIRISNELSELGISVSIGISSCRSSQKLPDAIVNADEDMYLQKSRPANDDSGTPINLKIIGS